ncbi:MAG TPA: nitrous oxide reductase family maturation protein NosD [Methylomirabilota bacterium]|nr:nitrous oxide reductase family maturation protein NosD [Methylomirabilota bacterium]
MRLGRKGPAVLAAGLLLLLPQPAAAATRIEPGRPLQAAVDAAAAGDVLVLSPGRYEGRLTIGKPLTLAGEPGAEIVGDGNGSVIRVTAPDVTIRGITVTGSGLGLEGMDSGVFLEQGAARALVEGNHMVDNLVGVFVHGAPDAMVRGNRIEGRRDLRMGESGNDVQVWNAPGAAVVGNDLRYGRDGIYVIASRRNAFQGNRMRDLRFAVHYMYTNDSEVSGNLSVGNHAGFNIMYSDRLKVTGNLSIGDRDKGLMLNYANMSVVTGNVVKAAPEKCLFLFDANKNQIRDNWFEGCDIGIHFTAGSERNVIAGNAFVGNRTQVKYVGTRYLDWSEKGRGNYWSDNPAFDLNGDGIADTAYRPNDLVDEVLWTAPSAKVLVNSPAVQVIRWAQAQFPALYPGGVVDSAPLMAPPAVAVPAWTELTQ